MSVWSIIKNLISFIRGFIKQTFLADEICYDLLLNGIANLRDAIHFDPPKKIDLHNFWLIIYIWVHFTHNPQLELNADVDLFYASPQECFV